jgi:hypothetical protein
MPVSTAAADTSPSDHQHPEDKSRESAEAETLQTSAGFFESTSELRPQIHESGAPG